MASNNKINHSMYTSTTVYILELKEIVCYGHMIKVETAYPHICISMRGDNSYHLHHHDILLSNSSIGGKELLE